MKYGVFQRIVLAVCVIAVVGLAVKVSSLGEEIRQLTDNNHRTIIGLQNAVKVTQASVLAAKESAPGLGEYMTTIQLHAGKLWFAANAMNWDLARYELDELKETMEVVKTLNAEKNGVEGVERFGCCPAKSDCSTGRRHQTQSQIRISKIL